MSKLEFQSDINGEEFENNVDRKKVQFEIILDSRVYTNKLKNNYLQDL